MHCHCGTNNRAPRWTFTDPCKQEVRPGAREESASPAWLAASAMNSRDTTKVYIWRLGPGCGPLLYRKCHSHSTPRKKGVITLESNPSRGTVPPAPHGKGNKFMNFYLFQRYIPATGDLLAMSPSHKFKKNESTVCNKRITRNRICSMIYVLTVDRQK